MWGETDGKVRQTWPNSRPRTLGLAVFVATRGVATSWTSTTPEEIYDGLYRIGSEDGSADLVPREVVFQLVGFKMVTTDENAKLRLTPYGEKCYSVMESGDGRVTEFE